MQQIKLTINLKKFTVDTRSYTLIQRCELLSIMIPRFCFHDKLSIAGNCRMCLVEVKKSPKPVISCSTKVMDGMEIFTNTTLVRQIREHIIEFLLINHPLDCPICDQGGECDLQDQTLIYGSDKGRFRELKRSVFDKTFSPFIKTVMTRCIHCTKCVRFIEEYGDMPEIGTLGRGGETEIGMYSSSILLSEISGNIIDLCPVGALTSKPYAFKARSWELTSVESLDIFDTVGTNISIQTRSNEILRILPRRNDFINECWITDQIRFGYDAFKRQRLLVPYSMLSEKNKIVPVSWSFAIFFFVYNLYNVLNFSKNSAMILTGPTMDLETINIIKALSNVFGIFNLNTSTWISSNLRSSFLLNNKISEIEFTNLFFLVGRDLKSESPILNLKIKKSTNVHSPAGKQSKVIYVGNSTVYNFPILHIGISTKAVLLTLYGKSSFCLYLKNAKSATSFSSLKFFNSLFFPKKLMTFNQNCLLFNVGDVCRYELNCQSHHLSLLYDLKKAHSLFRYFIGLENLHFVNISSLNSFNVFQGSNFSEDIIHFNLFLPSNNFTEGNINIFSNCEGRVQRTFPAVTSPGKSIQNKKLIFVLLSALSYVSNSNVVGLKLYNSFFLWKFPYVGKVNIVQSNSFLVSDLISHNYIWTTDYTFSSNKNSLSSSNNLFKSSPMLTKLSFFKKKSNNFINI